MQLSTEFCNSVIDEYSKQFTEYEIKHGYKGMDIHTAQIAMEVFRIAFEKLARQEDHN